MATEIWTAKEKTGEGADELIVFDVLDKETGRTRREERFTSALPLMMELGGTGAAMGMVLTMQPLPWRFKKESNGHIYIDGKSVGGDESYHPIAD